MPEVSAADVVKLSYLLPRDSSLRPSSGTDSFLFSSGAYAFGGGIAGLFANSKLFPQTSLVLTRFAKQVLGSAFCFSSCVLMRDNLTKPHRDINNVGQSALIRCSPFEGGELWIESSGGPLKSGGRSGQVHPFDKYVIFDPASTIAPSHGPTAPGWCLPPTLSGIFRSCQLRIAPPQGPLVPSPTLSRSLRMRPLLVLKLADPRWRWNFARALLS